MNIKCNVDVLLFLYCIVIMFCNGKSNKNIKNSNSREIKYGIV